MMLGVLGLITLARLAQADPTAMDGRMLVPLFLLYGLGQGLAQPALITTVIGSSGVADADAGAVVGLFLTTAQAVIALGVAAIGDVFFARLGPQPTAATYCAALAGALSWNLVLLAATFLLVVLLRQVGGCRRQHRSATRVAPTAPAAAVTGARQGAPASSVGNEVTGNGPARGHWRKEVTRVTHVDGPAHNGEREVSARCTMTMRAGVRAGVCKADQGDAAQVDGLVTVGVQRCGHLDILVNTAGVLVTGSDAGKGTKDEEASRQSGHCDGRIEGDRRVDCHASGSRRRCSRCQLCDEQSGR